MKKPEVEWDELYASTALRELFRYRKGDRVQSYHLRPLADGRAEVWVLSEHDHARATTKKGQSEKAGTFSQPSEAETFLRQREQHLKDQGWTDISK